MKDKDLTYLIEEIHKISGVTHVLPFDDVLAIDYDKRWVAGGFDDEKFVREIKRVVHAHGFKMLTMRTTDTKKFINLIP